jgi:tetratricopeptide (TPR) repeat protein
VNAVAAGEGRFLTLAGEPGIGKTRLAQEAMLLCRERGFVVATGRCYEPHQTVPYYPFLEALSTLYAAAPEAARAEASVRWPALLRLLPDQPTTPPSDSGSSPQEEQQRLFWAVTGFSQAVSETAPLALLLDDLHWADGASIELLQHLTRHSRSSRILLLGTYRDVEVARGHPLGRALLTLEREHLVERIAVSSFGPSDTAAMIVAQLEQEASGEFADLLHRHTDGNPLFIQETLRALIERGEIYRHDGRWERKDITAIEAPETIRATIAERVSRLSDTTQEALREASVLGHAFTFEDLQAMGGYSEATLDASLDEALAAGLLQEAGEGYIFNHALTQQTLYSELPPRRRRKLDLAAGEALERLPERARRARAAELAWHFRVGGAPERALPYAFLAGDSAQSLYAPHEAERFYQSALGLAASLENRACAAEAEERLGWLMWLLARFDSSAEYLEHAAETYRVLGDLEGEMRAVGLLGMVYFTVAPGDGVRRITSLLDRLVGQEPSKPFASLYASLAMNLGIAGRYPEAVEAAQRAAESARALGDMRTLIWAETTRAPVLGFMGRLEEGRRIGEDMIPIAEAANDYYGLLSAVHYLGMMCLAEGDFPAALGHYDRALQLAERLSARSRICAETANLAEVWFYRGEWQRARELAERALELMRAASSGRTASYFQYANVWRQVAMIRAAVGEWESARPCLEESIALAEKLPYPEALRASQGLWAEHEMASGAPEAALARLDPLVTGVDAGELSVMCLLPTLAEAQAALGDTTAAERILADAVAQAQAQHHLLALVDLLRAHGVVLTQQERAEEASRVFEEAVTVARSISYPYAEGRALYALGCLHSSQREWQAARGRLQEALDIFRRLGALTDEEGAAQALAACAAT